MSVARLACLMLVATPAATMADPGRISLTPEARAAAIEAASREPQDAIESDGPRRGIHGEAGIEIGSNGSRALYGTTVVPLGQTGVASFSFLTSQGGRWRYR